MVPEPSVPHTLLLLLGMPEALLSTWKFGRGWCGEVPEELRKRMKFALPSPSILNSCQLVEDPSSPCTTQQFPMDLMVFVPVTSRTGCLDRKLWHYWLVGSLSFGIGGALGSVFPSLGAVPNSQIRGEGSIRVASNARRQLSPGDSAGRQLMDLGSSSCPRYHT